MRELKMKVKLNRFLAGSMMLLLLPFLYNCSSTSKKKPGNYQIKPEGIFGVWIHHMDSQLLGSRMQSVITLGISKKPLKLKIYKKGSSHTGKYDKESKVEIVKHVINGDKPSGRLILKIKDDYIVYFFSDLEKNTVRIRIDDRVKKSLSSAMNLKTDMETEESLLFRRKSYHNKLDTLPTLKNPSKDIVTNLRRLYKTMMKEDSNVIKTKKSRSSGMGLLTGIHLKNEIRQKAFIKMGYNPFRSFDALVGGIKSSKKDINSPKSK
jgi:hypothetical protein